MIFYFYQKILVISVWQESKNRENRVNSCIFTAVVVNVFEEVNKWKHITMCNQLLIKTYYNRKKIEISVKTMLHFLLEL